MHFPCLGQETELVVGREKQIGHNEDNNNYEGFLYENRTLTTIQSSWHRSMIYKALINAGWEAKRARIRPTQRDSHGGHSDKCLSRACIAFRHYAIDSITYHPVTRQEARGVDASFKGLRVHPTYKGQETGGSYVSRKEVAPLSIREPFPRPLMIMALSRRFRNCTGTSVWFSPTKLAAQ